MVAASRNIARHLDSLYGPTRFARTSVQPRTLAKPSSSGLGPKGIFHPAVQSLQARTRWRTGNSSPARWDRIYDFDFSARGEADEIVIDPADQRCAIRLWRRVHLFPRQRIANERVDRLCLGGAAGNVWTARRLKRPLVAPATHVSCGFKQIERPLGGRQHQFPVGVASFVAFQSAHHQNRRDFAVEIGSGLDVPSTFVRQQARNSGSSRRSSAGRRMMVSRWKNRDSRGDRDATQPSPRYADWRCGGLRNETPRSHSSKAWLAGRSNAERRPSGRGDKRPLPGGRGSGSAPNCPPSCE